MGCSLDAVRSKCRLARSNADSRCCRKKERLSAGENRAVGRFRHYLYSFLALGLWLRSMNVLNVSARFLSLTLFRQRVLAVNVEVTTHVRRSCVRLATTDA